MKVIILKDVVSGKGWRREGDIIELTGKELNHYIAKGIAKEHKEEKAKPVTKEVKAKPVTKEAKAPAKRTTKKAK